MKNFIKEGQKLPMFGIGPYLMTTILLISITGIILSFNLLNSGTITNYIKWIFIGMGIVSIIVGVLLLYFGIGKSKVYQNIMNNTLKTDHVYSYVRNPMYSGCFHVFSGIVLLFHNYWLLLFIAFNYLLISVVLIFTEEKWLKNLYQDEYIKYKKSCNRLIPIRRIRKNV